jgi:hypothetical protein
MNQWMWAYIKPIVLQQLMQKGMFQVDDNNNAEDERVDRAATVPNNGGGN